MKKTVSVLSLSLIFTVCFFFFGINVSAMENANETLSTINGGTCSTRADGRCKIIVIGRNKCGRTVKTLHNIAQSSWIGKEPIDVVFIDCDGNDDASVQINELKDKVASPYITYCFYNNTALYKYYSYIGENEKDSDGSFSLPVVAYIDSNNNVSMVSSGTKSSDEIYYNLMNKYPVSGSENTSPSVNQTSNYYSGTSTNCDEKYEDFEIEEELIDEFEEEEDYCSDISECTVLGIKQKYYYPTVPNFEKDISVKDMYGTYLIKNVDYELDYDFITGCGEFRYIINGKGNWCGQIIKTVYVIPSRVNIITVKQNKSYTKIVFSDPGSYVAGYIVKVTLKNGSVKTFNITDTKVYSTVVKTKVPVYKTVTTHETVVDENGRLKSVPKVESVIVGDTEESSNAKYFSINISPNKITSVKIRPYFLSVEGRICSPYSNTYRIK